MARKIRSCFCLFGTLCAVEYSFDNCRNSVEFLPCRMGGMYVLYPLLLGVVSTQGGEAVVESKSFGKIYRVESEEFRPTKNSPAFIQ